MDFIEVPARDAIGALAAHSVRQGGLVIKKGEVITAAHVDALTTNGISRVTVAKLAPDDRHEDDVALDLARRAAGENVRVAEPFTGRANLFSEANGVLIIDAGGVDRFNAVDERITIATLPAYRVVETGEMIGTVKIIPFAVEGPVVERVAAHAGDLLRVAPFRSRKIGVISTLLPGLKPKTITKTLQALSARLEK
ncbi:MAG: molybdopterin-binding protein, partial [Beijerinckiaceae bacterium]